MARIKKIIDALTGNDATPEVTEVSNAVAECYTQDGVLVASFETLGEAQAFAITDNLIVVNK